jgi:CDP-paratose 2-epimerase
MKSLLVTGSSGLIGSEVCVYFSREGYRIHGLDNNQRAVFFGPEGDTRWNQQRLVKELPHFEHHELDIRDRQGILALVREIRPSAIIHTAAQPSHDHAAAIPFDDFDTNAVGTLNLLEAARQACPDSPFVHMSTNKVYGETLNRIALIELPARWDYAGPVYSNGIPETFTIDQSKHSLFGASKVAADIMVQEYGRYFNMPTCCLRGGCIAAPNHASVEPHGFLSFLVKCNLMGWEYRIFGHKGKQVRDTIHSQDVAAFMAQFCQAPHVAGVYNLGGGKGNSCSILEGFEMVEEFSGKKQRHVYYEENRAGDHICYYSDLRKMKSDYPRWDITISLRDTISQIVEAWKARV